MPVQTRSMTKRYANLTTTTIQPTPTQTPIVTPTPTQQLEQDENTNISNISNKIFNHQILNLRDVDYLSHIERQEDAFKLRRHLNNTISFQLKHIDQLKHFQLKNEFSNELIKLFRNIDNLIKLCKIIGINCMKFKNQTINKIEELKNEIDTDGYFDESDKIMLYDEFDRFLGSMAGNQGSPTSTP